MKKSDFSKSMRQNPLLKKVKNTENVDNTKNKKLDAKQKIF